MANDANLDRGTPSDPRPRPPGAGRKTHVPGPDAAFALTVTDWSVLGIACVGPVGLGVDDRLRLALDAGNDSLPIEVTGRIVWQQPGAQGHAYGLQFEGADTAFTAAWAPVCSHTPAPGVAPQPPNVWAYVEAPIVAPPRSFAHEPAPAWQEAKATPWVGLSPGSKRRLLGRPSRPETLWAATTGLLFAGAVIVAAYASGAGRYVAAPAMSPVPIAAAELTPHQPSAMPTPTAPAPHLPGSPAILLPPGGAGETAAVTLLFSADGPIGRQEIFWMQNPARLVVDILGRKVAQVAPVVAPPHPWVRRVRVGQHADRARFVIEVTADVARHVSARADGSALAVSLYGPKDAP